MPRANWGISAADVDNFDREGQYKPYDGPIPVNGVYKFQIKLLKFIAPTGSKLPQLRPGLELRSRSTEDKRYSGYFIMVFLPVSDKTAFRYVPFLDAIGVTGREFQQRTVIDQEGSIKKIGSWSHSGKECILAEIKDGVDDKGNSRKEVGWMGPVTDGADFDDDDYEEDEQDQFAKEYDDEEGDDEWE